MRTKSQILDNIQKLQRQMDKLYKEYDERVEAEKDNSAKVEAINSLQADAIELDYYNDHELRVKKSVLVIKPHAIKEGVTGTFINISRIENTVWLSNCHATVLKWKHLDLYSREPRDLRGDKELIKQLRHYRDKEMGTCAAIAHLLKTL